MKRSLNLKSKKAFIYCKNNVVCEVNNKLLKLTCYKYDEIVGKPLSELDILFKNNFQMCFEDIKDRYKLYIFTKDDFPKEVTITCGKVVEENEKVYYIEEELNPTLEFILSNFENIDIDKQESMVIHSSKDCIHLKSNSRYKEALKLENIDTDKLLGNMPPFPDFLLNLIKEGKSYHEHEVEFSDEKGGKSYWDISIRAISGALDKKYIISSFYNVTEKVIEKKALEKQRTEMKIILDNIPDSVVKLNKKGEYTYRNKANLDGLASYCGYDRSLNNKEVFELFKYNDIDGKELSFDETPDVRVLRGEELNNYIVMGTNHLPTKYYECNGTPIYDEEGNIDGAVLISRNIGDRLELEEYYAFKENRKDIFLNYASLSYEDFKIKYINEVGMNSIKKSMPHINSQLDVIGKSFFEFYENKDIIEDVKKAIKDNKEYTHNQKYIVAGEVEYLKTIFKPVFDENNKMKKINAIAMDVTEEETANLEMVRTIKAQEEIFINTSHELKTPLNIIFSASQLLNIYLKGENLEDKREKIKSNNSIIIQNCYRIIKLINNILDIARIEEGFNKPKSENRNIVKAVEDITQSVSEYVKDKNLTIIFNSEIEEKVIAFDLNKIERIILNLISNAIKFSSFEDVILVDIKDKGSFVEISVEDSGIGIAEEDLDVIFEKYKQVNKSLNRKVEGTGVGLSLVKSLVEIHGGRISVESTLGEGSTFKIELPVKLTDSTEPVLQESEMDKLELIKFELSDIYS